MKKKVKENSKNKDYTRGKYLDNKKLDAWNGDTGKKVMFSVCNDARNNTEVSPQAYNAWGIRYMGILLTTCIRTQYDTPIPLEHECTTNSQCSPSFSIRKGS